MARFEKDRRRAHNAGTRLYTPTRDSAALSYDPETGEPILTDAEGKVIPAPVAVAREMTTMERIGVMVCAFVFAGMVLFTLSGYERISRAYADINTLNDEIEDIELHISELNVSIECAVTIEQAETAALAAGMTYPTRAQIYNAADPIPAPSSTLSDALIGEDPTDSADADGGSDDDTAVSDDSGEV